MLSTPPAFILSQDQTLNKSFLQHRFIIWLTVLFRFLFSEISDNRKSEFSFFIPFENSKAKPSSSRSRIRRQSLLHPVRFCNASHCPFDFALRLASKLASAPQNRPVALRASKPLSGIFQGCIVVYLSRFRVPHLLATAYTIYHGSKSLSTGF